MKPPKGETEVQAAERIAHRLETFELESLACGDTGEYWEYVAVWVTTFDVQGRAAVELAFDGTRAFLRSCAERTIPANTECSFADGTTTDGWEICAAIAEHKGHGYPSSYLALRPSVSGREARLKSDLVAKAGHRKRLTTAWFEAIKARQVSPTFIHLDKDFSEVSAAELVWPDAKVSLCLWHIERAVGVKLGYGPNTFKTMYYPLDAKDIIPSLDPTFLPSNYNPLHQRRSGINRAGRNLPTTSSHPAPPSPHPQTTASQSASTTFASHVKFPTPSQGFVGSEMLCQVVLEQEKAARREDEERGHSGEDGREEGDVEVVGCGGGEGGEGGGHGNDEELAEAIDRAIVDDFAAVSVDAVVLETDQRKRLKETHQQTRKRKAKEAARDKVSELLRAQKVKNAH